MTAMNPSTGKRQIVDPEGEFIPGETIIKLYYWKRVDGYVTVPGGFAFQSRSGWLYARSCWLKTRGATKTVFLLDSIRRGRCESDRGAPTQANLIDAESNLILGGFIELACLPAPASIS